jgi:hypothetical protein
MIGAARSKPKSRLLRLNIAAKIASDERKPSEPRKRAWTSRPPDYADLGGRDRRRVMPARPMESA